MKTNVGKQGRCCAGKFRPMYLLVAGNDTVPTSVWRGGGIRSAVCCQLLFVAVQTSVTSTQPATLTTMIIFTTRKHPENANVYQG